MEKIEKYKAIDGNIFDDEDECYWHERKLLIEKYKISFFDKELNRLEIDQDMEEEGIYYIAVGEQSEKSLSVVIDIFNYYGIYYDDEAFGFSFSPSIWCWNDDACMFVDFHERYNHMKEKYERLNKAKERIENVLQN